MNILPIRKLAALGAFAAFALPVAASADALPSYATHEDQIKGTIIEVTGKYSLRVRDERGFVDRVSLKDGTVINPTGLTLAAGQQVTIGGRNAGSTFAATEIDTPYTIASAQYGAPYPDDGTAYPASSYAYPYSYGYAYPYSYPYGYGSAFNISLGFGAFYPGFYGYGYPYRYGRGYYGRGYYGRGYYGRGYYGHGYSGHGYSGHGYSGRGYSGHGYSGHVSYAHASAGGRHR